MEGRRLKGYTKAKERYQNYVDFLLKHLDGRKNKDEVITQRKWLLTSASPLPRSSGGISTSPANSDERWTPSTSCKTN